MKDILVTGAGGGMGSAICRLLLEKGYNVYGLDYKESPATNNFDTENFKFVLCDVTNTTSVENAVKTVKSRSEVLAAIIHTAGIYDSDSLIEMDEDRFCRVFDINLFGVYRINKAFSALLNRGSRIIITTSELAPLDPLPFTGIYAVSKSALEKYAYSLRMEVNLLGISVSIIRPGAVNTGLLNDSTSALDRFSTNTKLYQCNAKRFRQIADSVESRNIAPEAIAELVLKALKAKHPRFIYNINRNTLLRLLNALPDRIQVWIIKMILKS